MSATSKRLVSLLKQQLQPRLNSTRCLSQWTDFLQGLQGPSSKTDWTKAVLDAEKVVGYTTSYLNLRFLLSDEMSNVAFHLRSLVGSGHPLLKTAKRILADGKTAMQTRGLTVLLLSKAAGIPNQAVTDAERASGLLQSQRLLAEITEMLHTGFIVHRCIVNLPLKLLTNASEEPVSAKKDLDFGNKLSILTGDYLFANACTNLASLRNPKVVEIVSAAIGDYSESEFYGKKSASGVQELDPGFGLSDWLAKIENSAASLLARSCQAALVLSGHSEEQQQRAFEFGRNLAIAWQANEDLANFGNAISESNYDLQGSSLPLVLWIERNKDTLDLPLEMEKVVKATHKEGIAGQAEEIKNSYLEKALHYLSFFPSGAARRALENIVTSLR